MYSGTDHRGWRRFWEKRQGSLTPRQLTPFYNNFACMMGIVEQCGNAITLMDPVRSNKFIEKSVLEIGVGRGTMSELFHQKGFRTFCTDLENRLTCPIEHTFVKNDILESRPFAPEQFDITFSYGLLEHFMPIDRYAAIRRCLEMTKPGGLSMHYIVPKKWTNIFEDRSVFRSRCFDNDSIMKKAHNRLGVQASGVNYVYPVRGDSWETNSFLSKGFILWFKKYTSMDLMMLKHIEHMFKSPNPLLKLLEKK